MRRPRYRYVVTATVYDSEGAIANIINTYHTTSYKISGVNMFEAEIKKEFGDDKKILITNIYSLN